MKTYFGERARFAIMADSVAEPNVHDDIGYNWRPGELNAVLGLAQVRRADEILKRRRHIARNYDEKLRARRIPGIKLLEIPERIESSYYKYVVFTWNLRWRGPV